MKVTITADGTVGGTRIVLEDGTDITQYVADVSWRHQLENPAKMQIVLVLQPVTLEGEVTKVVGPTGRRVRSITYDDDGEVETFGIAPAGGTRVR